MTQQTPAINNTPAPLWRILAAMAYDSILVIAIWMVVTFIILSFFGVENARTLEGEAVVLDPIYKNITFTAMIVSAWAFYGWFWTHSGQTLGMQAWRIRVVSKQGQPITVAQSVVRFGAAMVSWLLLGIGYWMMLFNSEKETLHDKVSNTRLVSVPLMEKK
jgi:uncharacterized RDD family membrane protein YckC